jgi:hypothetical protein
VRTIIQLVSEEKISQHRDTEQVGYQLSAVLHGGARVLLVPNLMTMEQARFLERALAERLEIAGAAVEGEAAG